MALLALDTTLVRASAALALDGGRMIVRSREMARGHAEALPPLIAEVIAEAGIETTDLERVAVTVGPGSFTGLRVGIAAARAIALVAACPCIGIDTLSAIAESVRPRHRDRPVLAVLDARHDAVYARRFNASGQAENEPQHVPAATVAAALSAGDVVAGDAAGAVAALADVAVVPEPLLAPDVEALVRLGLAAAPDAALPPRPLYLRPPDARPQESFRIARR